MLDRYSHTAIGIFPFHVHDHWWNWYKDEWLWLVFQSYVSTEVLDLFWSIIFYRRLILSKFIFH